MCSGLDQVVRVVQVHLVGPLVLMERGQSEFCSLLPPLQYPSVVSYEAFSFPTCLGFPCVGAAGTFQSIHVHKLMLTVLIHYLIIEVGDLSSYSMWARPTMMEFSRQTWAHRGVIQVN
jgi:hypothetical protein